MLDPEYREQLIQTESQWNSGLSYRLSYERGGVSLFARPAFLGWVTPASWTAAVADLVIDECGQAYWIAEEDGNWALFRHAARSNLTERIIRLGSRRTVDPRRLWLGSTLMWIFDFSAGRALGLARDTFQILHEVHIGSDFAEIAFDDRGAFYALQRVSDTWNVCRYDVPPAPQKRTCIALETCANAAAVAVSPLGARGDIFVYCSDLRRLVRIRPSDGKQEIVGSRPLDALTNFRTADKATPMETDRRGVIYLASRHSPELHQFDPSGSYLGAVRLPRDIRMIIGIGFDSSDNLYLATDRGIAMFSLSLAEIGQGGEYYTRTLDSGVQGGQWHRVSLDADIPPRTSVEVRYHASDDAALKQAVDDTLASDVPLHERRDRMERLLAPLWGARSPEMFQSGAATGAQNDAPGLLLTPGSGRYLWLKLTLSTFDESNRPSVRSMRVLYPRSSYLRYLPATYREDPVHAAFVERFLALFETIFHGLDRQIDLLFRHFDPQLAPAEFLRWLASWINLTVEDDVPRDRVRRLIQRSPQLYRSKGTPAALAEFLQIYTGRRAFVVEQPVGFRPLLLGGGGRMGHRTVLLGSVARGVRIGDSSIVGSAVLRDFVRDPQEPFVSMSGRFTVLIDMAPTEFAARRRTLERIIDTQKPAHTACTLRNLVDRSFAGTAVLGAGAAVTERQPYQIGVTSLGRGIAGTPRPGLRVERGAWLGSEAGLT